MKISADNHPRVPPRAEVNSSVFFSASAVFPGSKQDNVSTEQLCMKDNFTYEVRTI